MGTQAPGTSMSVTATVALWNGGAEVDSLTMDVATLGPGEVLVRLSLATVCASDRDIAQGRAHSARPAVLGHEGVGVVEAVGRGGDARTVAGEYVREGQRIIWATTVPCGTCTACDSRHPLQCRSTRRVGEGVTGEVAPMSGTFATHLVLPEGAAIVEAPVCLPDAVVAPANCVGARAAAAVERAGELGGKRVVVLTAGLRALTAVAMAAEGGARSITVVDADSERRARALEFGADAALADSAALPAADVVLDFGDDSHVTEAALDNVGAGGVVVMAGARSTSRLIALDARTLVDSEVTLAGVSGYEPRHLVQAIDLLTATHAVRPWTSLVGKPQGPGSLASLLFDPETTIARASIAW